MLSYYTYPEEKSTKTGEREQRMKVYIKYFDQEITRIEKITQGDWIDLRSAETVEMKAGELRVIRLGVGMILPEGFEAHVAPRSSTYKNFGIIQTNSIGIIDHSYCGEEDEWKMSAYALRDTVIHKNDRICQFRIVENQPRLTFTRVAHLDGPDRGGFGSTGK